MSDAAHTMTFTNFHAGSPICSPSRAAMLAGQYPDRNCVSGATTGLYFQARNNTPTFAHDAKQAGYATLFLGKWHLSGVDNDMIGRSGFDSWTGTYGNILTFDSPCMCTDVACKAERGCSNSSGSSGLANKLGEGTCAARRVGSASYCYDAENQCELGATDRIAFQTVNNPAQFECGMKTKKTPASPIVDAGMPRAKMACDFLVDKFEDFLHARGSTSPPFLAVINFHEVHTPLVADPAKRQQCEAGSPTCTKAGLTAPKSMGVNSAASNYYSVLESLDAAVGRVRLLLRQYKLADDTFVVFTSDNGPEKPEQGGAGSAHPFQGLKRSLYEGGHRVPAVIESRKWIRSGAPLTVLSTSLVSLLDLRPTIRAILKKESSSNSASLRPEAVLDGESLLPLFASYDDDGDAQWTRSKDVLICLHVSYTYIMQNRRVRLCDSYAYFRSTYKIIVSRDQETVKHGAVLFNLRADPGETVNLASKQPALFQSMVSAARAQLASVFSTYDTACGGQFQAPTALDPNVNYELVD